MIEFTTKLDKFESNLWAYHMKVPGHVVSHFQPLKDRRFICIFNDDIKIHCAFMPDGEGGYFINLNKEIRKKLSLWQGDEISVKIEKDTSKYGMEMPEEFGELLKQEPVTDKHFHALTPGKQRNLIFMVAKPKQSATRLKKALAISEYLKMSNGALDFKELNQFFKDFKDI